MAEFSHPGTPSSGTRRVYIALSFLDSDALADDIAFTLAAPTGPQVITPCTLVSASGFGGFSDIAPGSWIEIYGANLTSRIAAEQVIARPVVCYEWFFSIVCQ